MTRMLFRNFKQFCLLGVCIAAFGLAERPALGAERYFAFVFSSQARPKLPRYTHVWAAMVKVCNVELPPEQWGYQVDTISWFPKTMVVHTFWPHPEPGINLSLRETICHVHDQGQHISVWGPFEAEAFFYQEFMTQKARLESGRVLYQCIDSLQNPEHVSDCIHSLTDMDRGSSRRDYPLSRFGDDAAEEFVRVLRERGRLDFVRPENEFAYKALGLQSIPITRRWSESQRHGLLRR